MSSQQSIDPARISETANRLLEEFHLPGLSVGVVSGDDLVYAEGFGWADIESRRVQDPELHQRIGSITKTMVCLCTMALVEEGKLSLDDRVADLLPDLQLNGHGDTLKLWHLLTHTGGIGEAPTEADVADPLSVLWSDGPDIPPIPEKYPDGITIDVKPGTKWHYANHGWMLVGEIVARAEGATIEEVLERRIFEPLGMTVTDNYDRPAERLTTGYHHAPGHESLDLLELLGQDDADDPVDGHNIRGEWIYVNGRAAGSVHSNIPDMARYASALLRNGAGIVSPETFAEMLKPQWCPDDRMGSLGLSFFRTNQFGEFVFGHGGGIAGGWNTDLTIIPGRNLGMMVHINASLDVSDEVYSQILRSVLGAAAPELPAIALDPKVIAAAPGVYSMPPGKLTNSRPIRTHGRLQITEESGELILRSRRGAFRTGVRLLPADKSDPFFLAIDTPALQKPEIALVTNASGEVTRIRLPRLAWMDRDHSLEPWA
jgi:CubicO group peptidase (beta-lactamase class C family)